MSERDAIDFESPHPNTTPFKNLIVLHSYHHRNTAKVAEAMAGILGARIVAPAELDLARLDEYELIGFGAGIDSGRHYQELLDAAGGLPDTSDKKAFIFSTSAIYGADKMKKDHAALRTLLQAKGYSILGEWSCRGFNTNSFLKLLGGMNKGRPNVEDLRQAGVFAEAIRDKMNGGAATGST